MPNKSTNKNKFLPTEKIFSISFLESLPYKTPYFIFSNKKIIENYKNFKKTFPYSSVHYAMKANSEPKILKILLDEGAGFEVASAYELNLLKKIKASPSRIIFGSAVKATSQIKKFYRYGVDRFACDSIPELEKIASVAPKSKVYIRTIANDSSSVFKLNNKFGADETSIIPMIIKSKELGLHPYGISFHVGSQASDPEAWANVLIGIRSILQELKSVNITIDIINMGGGFPCKYASSENAPLLSEISTHIYHQYNKLPYKPKIILEPGRGLIADTAVAVGSVIGRVERLGTTWLFLDLGCYNGLFEAMAYQGSTRYSAARTRPSGNVGESLFALAGPTGDSQDIISRETLLPSDTTVGDKIVFYNVGAYSIGMSIPFNGFPKPDAYFL